MFSGLESIVLNLLGQVAPTDAGDVSVKVNSVWDFVVKGGPVMIPIGICSLVAITVIVERMVSLRRRQIIPPGFVTGVRAILSGGPSDRVARALEYCRSSGTPLANIFAAGIKKLGEPAELVEKRIQETGQAEIQKLRKYLRSLSVIAAIAPLLGLLGTILGMITAFETVAASPDSLGRTELLAGGIYEALITTAAGLIVAIPVVIAFHWFAARVDRLVLEMDAIVIAFVEEFARPTMIKEAARESAAVRTPALITAPSDNGNAPAAAVALATG